MRFWGVDEARVTCPLCGMEQEVEVGEVEELTSGEKSEVALLVPMGESLKDDWKLRHREQKN